MSAKHIVRRRLPARRICALVMVTALLAVAGGQAAGADKVYNANPKPPTDGLIGSNYTSAYAVNQVQFWHDFRPKVVEKELAAARKYFGISTLRVYLHNINFDEEKKVFLANLEKFLTICDKHQIRPGFVFFDGCHRHEGIFLDKPTKPVSGYHNGRWAQCPQARDIDKNNLAKFKPYVQEVIRAHRTDKRVLFWEIHNEPPPGDKYRDRLKKAGYKWAKEVKPTQPVLNCEKGKRGWGDCDVTDIVDAHVYSHAHGPLRVLSDMNPRKGTVFTEAGARWKASRRNFGGPIDMVYWLGQRRRQGKSTPGMYLCWELMVGNSNCRWHWIDKPGAPEPEIPWCGLLWPDCTPVSLAEAEAVRRYATGKSDALFFEDFERHSAQAWKPYPKKNLPTRNAVTLEPGMKAIAGDAKWTDYILEGRVVIKPGKKPPEAGHAGLLLRVSKPGEDLDQMRGYAVTFDRKSLVLSKIDNGSRKALVTCDLTKLKTHTRINEWSMIRTSAAGPRIRVWFNRMHPSSDPDRGLRIDYTDKKDPILSGAIGLRTHRVSAWFDNIVVLPVGAAAPARVKGWPEPVRAVQYLSDADRTQQPAMFYAPKSKDPVPLLVGLHTWSGDYRQSALGAAYAKWCIAKGWAFIGPNFRGPNRTPQATGSEPAVKDVLSAVDYAKARVKVDASRIYLVGASGGGHMALLMAGRAPKLWAGVSAWAGISDLKAWHRECTKAKRKYARDIELSCGGPPGKSAAVDRQYALRSPLTHLPAAGKVRLPMDINAGITDGHTGSVPVSHSLRAFNAVADRADRIAEKDIDLIVRTAKVPTHLKRKISDPTYGPKIPLMRKTSGAARITIFKGGHEIVVDAALNWLARQKRR